MISCLYKALTVAVFALGAFGAWMAVMSLYDNFQSIKRWIERYDFIPFLVPTAAAIYVSFVWLHTGPQYIKVVDCGTNKRVEKIVLDFKPCEIKKG